MALSTANVSYRATPRFHTDYRAMSVATALFFMWGFLTCLNDILIPHLRSIFELSLAQAALVQTAFFSSYFVFAFPSGKLVEYYGYKRTMVVGLAVMAAGALLFVPAAALPSFTVFLVALAVLAAGITTLQVAANPYVTALGPAETASSRLNFAQAFNSLGTFAAPFLGAWLILGAAPLETARLHSLPAAAQQLYRAEQASSVKIPYTGIALALLLLAVALALVRIPSFGSNTIDYRPIAGFGGSIWGERWLLFGAAAIFFYVGAEVSIGSFLISYFHLPELGAIPEKTAARLVSVYWGGAMVGRLIGSAILLRVRTGLLLAAVGTVALLLVVVSMFSHGWLAVASILAVGLFNSVMFPSIFSLGLAGLGDLTSKGSSLMVQAIVGGAVIPFLYGRLADSIGVQKAFVLPVVCYAFIAAFGFLSARRPMVTAPSA